MAIGRPPLVARSSRTWSPAVSATAPSEAAAAAKRDGATTSVGGEAASRGARRRSDAPARAHAFAFLDVAGRRSARAVAPRREGPTSARRSRPLGLRRRRRRSRRPGRSASSGIHAAMPSAAPTRGGATSPPRHTPSRRRRRPGIRRTRQTTNGDCPTSAASRATRPDTSATRKEPLHGVPPAPRARGWSPAAAPPPPAPAALPPCPSSPRVHVS